MTERFKPPGGRATRGDRRIQEYQHDTYMARRKLKGPTLCPRCRAVFLKGRWSWGEIPKGAREFLCPACHRIQDHCPQGLVTLKGQFFTVHQNEILGLVRNEEARAKAEHPLSRIIAIQHEDDATMISTTDTHLPRRIGAALHHAYEGQFSFHYDPDEHFIRVRWER